MLRLGPTRQDGAGDTQTVRFVGWADWVDCRCFLSFVFLGVARRLELSPCNTHTRTKLQTHPGIVCHAAVVLVWQSEKIPLSS